MTRRMRYPSGRRLAAVAAAAVLVPLGAASPALAGGREQPASHAVQARSASGQDAVPAAAPGTAVQYGVPVVSAGADPVTTTFHATLPAGTPGPVMAQLAFPADQLPAGGYTSSGVAAGLHATCSVNGGTYLPCGWTGGADPAGDYLRLALPPAAAAAGLTYSVRIAADPGTLPADQLLTGWIELTTPGPDGGQDGGTGDTVLADGVAQFRYQLSLPAAGTRGQMYAVDRDGVLWRYEGTGASARPFLARQPVGGGWGQYTAITPLSSTDAAGRGDLVARDRSGVLWYYRGSGNPAQPFEPRVRVGGGWNTYTALTGTGGQDGNLRSLMDGELVARDHDGVLWYYRATGDLQRPFAARARVGGGWNAYTELSVYGNGIVARDASGVLWSYTRDPGSPPGGRPFLPRVRVGGGWNRYTAFSGALVGPYAPHVLAARSSAGGLYLYGDAAGRPQIPGTAGYVGAGWNVYTVIF
ncbi:MAG: tachylectin-related carbohydrate-binding protein [Actinomycetia bacterium]|nr:tachylectin-related carbohydrate-binding protein [Actinomycetes bacterium]